MLTATPSTCVSNLEKKALTFGKEAAMNNQPMPVTVKSFPSVYFEEDSYEGHNYELFWTKFQTADGLDGRSGIMMEELLLCDAGRLAGRVYGAFLDPYAVMDPYSWPTIDRLKDSVIEVAENWRGDFFGGSVIFSVYEIEEHTADYLRGVLRWYEYIHDGHRLEHQAGDDEGIVILLHPNDR